MFCKLERINNFKIKYLYRDQELSIFQEKNQNFSYNGVKSRPILMSNSSHLFFLPCSFGGIGVVGTTVFLVINFQYIYVFSKFSDSIYKY